MRPFLWLEHSISPRPSLVGLVAAKTGVVSKQPGSRISLGDNSSNHSQSTSPDGRKPGTANSQSSSRLSLYETGKVNLSFSPCDSQRENKIGNISVHSNASERAFNFNRHSQPHPADSRKSLTLDGGAEPVKLRPLAPQGRPRAPQHALPTLTKKSKKTTVRGFSSLPSQKKLLICKKPEYSRNGRWSAHLIISSGSTLGCFPNPTSARQDETDWK